MFDNLRSRKVVRGFCALTLGCTVAAGAFVPVAPAVADESEWTIARIWNEEALQAIRQDFARPPVHARNLYHVSTAMFDAWAAYDPVSQGVYFKEKIAASDVEAARHEAISYAVYRLIEHRFANSPGADITLPNIEARLVSLGYDPENTSTIGNSPAAVGNRVAQTIIEFGLTDGSNELENYKGIDPITGEDYEPANEPLVVEWPGAPTLVFPNKWQSIWLEVVIDQQGNILDGNVPDFVGPHWGLVAPFSLREDHKTPGKPGVYLDPGPPPMLGESEDDDELWLHTFTDVLLTSSVMDPDLDIFIDISPGVFGNNPIGSNDGEGHGPNNPVTGEPYESNVVRYGDYARIIAEFWADGPMSSTPPGHWNEMANEFVTDHPDFERRLGGVGPTLDPLEWDVKMYLAINGAAHDSAVACWGVKGYYDWVRPISAIRHMADNGQRTDPKLPSYHPYGLPLIEGKIELITEDSIKPGGKHWCLAEMVVDKFGEPVFDDQGNYIFDGEQFIGELAVYSWPGSPWDPVSLPQVWVHPDCIDQDAPYSGNRWFRAKRWSTYQLPTFITPPFAGYTSGHTTYSRAIARVLEELTGMQYWPGGLAEYTVPKGWLDFEHGPSEDITLQWTSFYDASDQSARSRIYGGIHPYVDDFPARFHGHEIGGIVAEHAFKHFNGTVFPPCPGDFTGDGVVNVSDMLQLFDQWGTCPKGAFCPADLNGDGFIDLTDLLILFDNWGECPQEAAASHSDPRVTRESASSPHG
jgi:hypothetical protein